MANKNLTPFLFGSKVTSRRPPGSESTHGVASAARATTACVPVGYRDAKYVNAPPAPPGCATPSTVHVAARVSIGGIVTESATEPPAGTVGSDEGAEPWIGGQSEYSPLILLSQQTAQKSGPRLRILQFTCGRNAPNSW